MRSFVNQHWKLKVKKSSSKNLIVKDEMKTETGTDLKYMPLANIVQQATRG